MCKTVLCPGIYRTSGVLFGTKLFPQASKGSTAYTVKLILWISKKKQFCKPYFVNATKIIWLNLQNMFCCANKMIMSFHHTGIVNLQAYITMCAYTLYFQKLESLGYTFLSLIVWVQLHSFSRGCLPKMRTRAKFGENLNLQQFKVI